MDILATDCKYDIVIRLVPEHVIVSKVAKIRNRYNQVPHLTQDTNGKVTNSQKTPHTRAKRSALFPAGDHEAHINRRAQNIANTRQNKNIKDPLFLDIGILQR